MLSTFIVNINFNYVRGYFSMNTTTKYLPFTLCYASDRPRGSIYFIAHRAEQVRDDLTRTMPVQ